MDDRTAAGGEVEAELPQPLTGPRPNFLYVGVGKAGSTWIFEALKAHPEVFVPPAKDLYYFSRDYARGPQWYSHFFKAAGPEHKALGELSISYLQREDALRRIGRDLPEARILISLRNPIARAWSAYTHMRRNHQISCTFREAIDRRIGFVTESSHYMRHLRAVDRHLKTNPVKIVLFDDLRRDAAAFAREIFDFLGVDPEFDHVEATRNALPASIARNQRMARLAKRTSGWLRDRGAANLLGRIKSNRLLLKALYKPIDRRHKEQMTEEDWEYLRELYAPGVEELAERLGRDLGHWIEGRS